MGRLSVRLLGPFQVRLDSEPVTRFETKKVRALLAYLAAEAERLHQRAFLAEMFWPDRRRGTGRANLRHVLSDLRQVIGDRTLSGDRSQSGKPADPPFLLVTRPAIQLNREADVWVDTAAFLHLLEGQASSAAPTVGQLEDAVELYRGPFLEDISLADSATFHEWVLLKREYFRQRTMGALRRIAECYEIQGMFERGLEYARRQVELEPWGEHGHRQVMRLLALDGRRGLALAQYEVCCRLLAEELGVEPEIETTELFERIRDDRLDIPTRIRKPALVLEPPGFLDEEAEDELEPPAFVARERELARLGSLLEQALNGQGGVVLITGGPGQGKTALLDAFARRAMGKHSNLLVARGNCSAYSGVGDPHLPFRDLLAMLTGDVEALWAGGTITRDHARRLWKALPTALEALLTRGASLIGPLLQAEALLSRAAAVLPHRVNWLKRLRVLAGQARERPVELEQSFIFEQLTSVLRTLAEHYPLVLVLDDVQWADRASISLLFHLGRRLAGSRILIACAYRPHEVALGRDGRRHPLEKVLYEFRSTFGDVRVDLDRVDAAEGRRFLDALLDTEANRLGEGFRGALYRRTGGHPLFTIELLRAMRERGDILKDQDGRWIAGLSLDWQTLPARVEAVIDERISRLDPELQQIVSVASVEGEVFTAQVVAKVRGMEEVQLLRRLSQELKAQHRLVSEQGEAQAGPRRIDRYRFSHILVQNYVYRRLGRGERRVLHGAVGAALEGLHQGRQDEIAVELARHFDRADDAGRAFHYYELGAAHAARAYAYDEAVTLYTRAIEVAERVSTDGVSLAKLRRGRGLARGRLGQFDRARADHEAILQTARAAQDRRLEWRALIDLGKLWASRDYAQTRVRFQQGLELARRMDDPAALASSLNWMGNWHANAENPLAAVEHHQEALEIVETLGDHRALTRTLDLLGLAYLLTGDLGASVPCYDRAIALARKVDDRRRLVTGLIARSVIVSELHALASVPVAEPPDALRDLEEAIGIAREIDSPADETWAHWALGLLHTVRGRFGSARETLENGLRIASSIGHREYQVANRCALGVMYVELLAPERARRHLTEALDTAGQLRSQVWTHRIAGALAGAHLLLKDTAAARTCLETVLSAQTPTETTGQRYCWARRAELALAQNDPALALDITDRLIAAAPGLAPGRVVTFLWKLKGEAFAAMGDTEAASPLLQAAIENARSTGERFLLWRLHASLGRMCRATDRRLEAEKAFATARALVHELAETVPAGELRKGFLQRARERLGSSP